MRKQKKLLSLLLALAMVLSLLPTVALAADTTLPVADKSGVITLTEDVDISSAGWTVSGDVTLDLNGHTLKVANTSDGHIKVTGSLTLKDSTDTNANGTGTGKLYTETDYSGSATGYGIIEVIGGSFTLESGYIYAVRADAENKGQFGIAVTGNNSGSVTINGGKIEAGWYAISGNGKYQGSSATITINGGTLVSTADYALYLPHSGTTTIKGGVVTGAAGGIAQRSGTLKIEGGIIASKGTGNTGEWVDGSSGMGNSAVNIGDNNRGLYGNCTVNITGGDFTAANGAVTIAKGTSETYSASVSVTGGTFNDLDCLDYLASNANVTVKLGTDTTKDVVIPANTDVTLDLNGKTLTVASDCGIEVAGELIIKDTASNGEITCDKTPVMVSGTGEVTLESGAIKSTGDYGSYVKDGGTFIVNGGEINSLYAPLSGNNTTGDMSFEVNGGTLTATQGPAIYMPGQVSLKITGGTLNGGISLRMGQVDISGGTIRNTNSTYNTDSVAEFYSYSGNVWFDDALYVLGGSYTSGNENYGNSLNLNITGGTIESTIGDGVAIYALGKTEQALNISIRNRTAQSFPFHCLTVFPLMSTQLQNTLGMQSDFCAKSL